MKKSKRWLSAFIMLLISVYLLPLSVFANAPASADHLKILISNLPADAVYADILIKIDEEDLNYIDFQSSVYGDDRSLVKEIAEYSKDGYRSFTLHYKNAKSNIVIDHYYDEYQYVYFCAGYEYRQYLTQYEDLCKNYSDFKIAILDKNYKIICVSDADTLPKQEAYSFYGYVYYDASNGIVDVDYSINSYYIVFGALFAIIATLLSVGMETVTAVFFKIRGSMLFTVVVLNFCTQIVMRLLYIALPFNYLLETIIFEFLVYVTEFIVYKKRFAQLSTAKILTYTVTANTVSLIIGILFHKLMLVL